MNTVTYKFMRLVDLKSSDTIAKKKSGFKSSDMNSIFYRFDRIEILTTSRWFMKPNSSRFDCI